MCRAAAALARAPFHSRVMSKIERRRRTTSPSVHTVETRGTQSCACIMSVHLDFRVGAHMSKKGQHKVMQKQKGIKAVIISIEAEQASVEGMRTMS